MMAFLKKLGISFLISSLIYFNLRYWQLSILGWIFVIFQSLLTSLFVRAILIQVFHFTAHTLRTKIFSLFLSFYSLGLIGGLFILSTTFSSIIMALVFLLNAILWLALKATLTIESEQSENIFDVFKQGIAHAQEPKSKISVLIYLVLRINCI